ncbi:hypothetical protein Barb4_01285 [Bacteroidales bacterium Barb4]|nr:hypothetical protein Barb4_01285 [Bacteroidales bacterium Barb4]
MVSILSALMSALNFGGDHLALTIFDASFRDGFQPRTFPYTYPGDPNFDPLVCFIGELAAVIIMAV